MYSPSSTQLVATQPSNARIGLLGWVTIKKVLNVLYCSMAIYGHDTVYVRIKWLQEVYTDQGWHHWSSFNLS